MNKILKIRTARDNYFMECTESFDGKTFEITDSHLDIYQNGECIRHIELTTNIKLELNRIQGNTFIKDIGWARTWCVWCMACDNGDEINKRSIDYWSMCSNWEYNKLENEMIQKMMTDMAV